VGAGEEGGYDDTDYDEVAADEADFVEDTASDGEEADAIDDAFTDEEEVWDDSDDEE